MTKNADYLGDSVYVVPDAYGFWLHTDSHLPQDAGNKIFFEPEVFQALIRWEGNYVRKETKNETLD